MIELRLIRQALALQRHQNFARAAHALNLTQPSLSRSIALLEDAVGVRLFDRGPKQVVPTVFGEILLERGAEMLRAETELVREIHLLASLETGKLVIGAAPYPTSIFVGSAVARLASAYPKLKLRVITGDADMIMREVQAGECDVGLVAASALEDRPKLKLDLLSSYPMYLACRPGHPLAGVAKPSMATIMQFPLVSSLLGPEAAGLLKGFDRAGQTDPDSGMFRPAIHVNTLALARKIARESDALFPGTAGMLAPDLKAGTLVRLDFHHPIMQLTPGLITLKDRSLSPAAKAFMGEVIKLDGEFQALHDRT